jgi:hypothetical protein
MQWVHIHRGPIPPLRVAAYRHAEGGIAGGICGTRFSGHAAVLQYPVFLHILYSRLSRLPFPLPHSELRAYMSCFAYFISPHGFGHASRASAVMAAVQAQCPGAQLEVFTTVPPWFFGDSLSDSFNHHPVETDIGMVQVTPMQEDLDATIVKLDGLLPFDTGLITALSDKVTSLNCSAILCDIAPMGIAVARKAGLPSVLIENFTWDWIYEGYADLDRRFESHLAYLRDLFQSADVHIQTRPHCLPCAGADLVVDPVSREPKGSAEGVRRELGVAPDHPIVLITMGGTSADLPVPAGLDRIDRAHFVVPSAISEPERQGNVTRLPYRSPIYYPDLISSCSAVVAKVGYSTVAEVHRSGIPFGFIPRPRFRESAVLVDFAQQHMSSLQLPANDVDSGAWLDRLPDLLSLPRRPANEENGATTIARHILSRYPG